MGANYSVVFISCTGEEVPINADVLSAASVVWRERLQLVGKLSPSPRAEENGTTEEIQSFAKLLSAFTQDAKEESFNLKFFNIKTMGQALPLVHKYDCPAAKKMLEMLEKEAFPSHGVNSQRTSNASIVSWVTQDHIDYVVTKQELYGPRALTENMKKLLVSLTCNIALVNDTHGPVHIKARAEDELRHNAKFMIPAWRINPETIIHVLTTNLVQTAF